MAKSSPSELVESKPLEQVATSLAAEVDKHIRRVQIKQHDYSRAKLAERLDVAYSTLNNVLSGWRPPSEKLLMHLLFILSDGDPRNDAEFIDRWNNYAHAYSNPQKGAVSRTYRIALGAAPLRIGYLNFSCWANDGRQTSQAAEGIVPELLQLLAKSLNIVCEWTALPLQGLVNEVAAGHVDIAAGYICRTPTRTTRTVFVPLDFPTELGIQALTRMALPKIDSNSPLTAFQQRRDWIEQHAKTGALQIVIVEGEIACEQRHNMFAVDVPIRIFSEPPGDIDQALARFGRDKDVVIVTDHVTCEAAIHQSRSKREPGLQPFELVFQEKVGSFVGGFLLPASDPEFLKFFRRAYQSLMNSRMPAVGEVILKYADQLLPFMPLDRFRIPKLPPGARRSRGMMGQPTTLAQWLVGHWSPDIPVPEVWKQHILIEEKHLRDRLTSDGDVT
jgi:hypothetical protein